MSIAAWPSIETGDAAVGLLAGLAQEPVAQEQPEQTASTTIMMGPPTNSAR